VRNALAVLLLLALGACKNTYHEPRDEDPRSSIEAVRTGRLLVWADVALAMRICGQFMLESAWLQIFSQEGEAEPPAMDESAASMSEVRALATNEAGVSFAVLTHVLSKRGFGSLMLEQNVQNAGGPATPSMLTVRREEAVRELRFSSESLPRLIVTFSPDVVRRRNDSDLPGAGDRVTSLSFAEPASAEALITVDPPLPGAAGQVKLATGEFASCVREELSILGR
jgi:hypothetical protein